LVFKVLNELRKFRIGKIVLNKKIIFVFGTLIFNKLNHAICFRKGLLLMILGIRRTFEFVTCVAARQIQNLGWYKEKRYKSEIIRKQ